MHKETDTLPEVNLDMMQDYIDNRGNRPIPILITMETFCDIFKIPRITAERWIEAGKLKKLKVNGKVLIEQTEVDRIIDEARGENEK